jgi:hypothetical protein
MNDAVCPFIFESSLSQSNSSDRTKKESEREGMSTATATDHDDGKSEWDEFIGALAQTGLDDTAISTFQVSAHKHNTTTAVQFN